MPDAGWLSVKYNATEFANALKPVFLLYLAEFVEKVIYLDTDIAVFSPLTTMLEVL